MFELDYKKMEIDISNILPKSVLDLENVQNYMPLYNKFFKLDENNFNSICLNNNESLIKLLEKKSYNIYQAEIKNEKDIEKITSEIFIKFSPILDPLCYLSGKFDSSDNIFSLPTFGEEPDLNKQVLKENNISYIDSFFSFLLSKIKFEHNFVHALNHYGSFVANFNDYQVNIYDDIEILADSNFFNDNINKLFTVDNLNEGFFENNSRKNKKVLEIKEDLELLDVEEITIESKIKAICKTNSFSSVSSSSTCSSRLSDTDNDSESEISDEEEYTSESDYSDDEDEIIINAYIKNYPVTLILLEKCKQTLDDYMINSELSQDEWSSIFIQIIFQLIAYQKMFDFTHNDLHTNNIMYVETNKEFVNYTFEEKNYKVPTYGKIWKIIDFGRAIFKYKNHIFCSDSFHPKGDAAGQYNCQPFFNKNKPELLPNFSFDLSRLGCSLFDYFFEDIDDLNKSVLTEVEKLVSKWCLDDENRNVLYKKNGKERYPEFKLYKMIARTVHHCEPKTELLNPMFQKYVVSRKKISKKQAIINIDLLPKYF